MIPGIGAGIRLWRGIHRKNELESRIHTLEELCSTPAVGHYGGLQRFEVATVIADAKIGLLLDSGASQSEFAGEADTYLQVMEREFMMVLDQATNAPATKAEVYALGMALKEVALSFEDSVTEFRDAAEEHLARIDLEVEASRKNTAQQMAGFDKSFRIAVEEFKASAVASVSEIGRRADMELTKLQALESDLSAMRDEWSAASSEVRQDLSELKESSAALIAEFSQHAGAALASLERGMADERARLERTMQDLRLSASSTLERMAAGTEERVQKVVGQISTELADHRQQLDARVGDTRMQLESSLGTLKVFVIGLAVVVCLLAGVALLK